MLTALALAAALGTQAAQADMLTAFQDTCIPRRGDYEASVQRLAGSEWAPVEADDHPSLGALMALGQSALGGDVQGKMSAFRRGLGDDVFYVVLTDVNMPTGRMAGCYLYNFESDKPLSAESVTAWLGQSPEEIQDVPGVLVSQKWPRPTSLPETAHVQNAFIPAESPLASQLGFHGSGLVITTLAD